MHTSNVRLYVFLLFSIFVNWTKNNNNNSGSSSSFDDIDDWATNKRPRCRTNDTLCRVNTYLCAAKRPYNREEKKKKQHIPYVKIHAFGLFLLACVRCHSHTSRALCSVPMNGPHEERTSRREYVRALCDCVCVCRRHRWRRRRRRRRRSTNI